jgi:hypothetical protein
VINSKAVDQSSRYRRLQRFISGFTMDFDIIAGFIFRLFFVAGGKWSLTMDRTNWKWGKSNINILILGIAYQGTAIPIYWDLLDKRGNSDTTEKIAWYDFLSCTVIKIRDGNISIQDTRIMTFRMHLQNKTVTYSRLCLDAVSVFIICVANC